MIKYESVLKFLKGFVFTWVIVVLIGFMFTSWIADITPILRLYTIFFLILSYIGLGITAVLYFKQKTSDNESVPTMRK